jgi:hypothetical protein
MSGKIKVRMIDGQKGELLAPEHLANGRTLCLIRTTETNPRIKFFWPGDLLKCNTGKEDDS